MSRIVKGIGLFEGDLEGRHDAASHLQNYELTDAILSAYYFVYNRLGYGFLEKVYKHALAHELRKRGFHVEIEAMVQVYYDGEMIGEYFADLIVNHCIILELKATDEITDAHRAQLLNYLKATQVEVGLILNFGPKPQIARKAFSNARKTHPIQPLSDPRRSSKSASSAS